MRLGIIDIGSNSIRLVLYEILEGSYRVIGQVKRSARLGSGMVNGEIDRNRIEYALSVLKGFKSYLDTRDTQEIIVVATEAVRKARNKQGFLSAAKIALGREIRVLSGEEEAFYDYYATVNTLDLRDCLMVDIGGSSMEIVHIENRILQDSISLPFGAITLTEKFGLKSSLRRESDLVSYLKQMYGDIPWLKNAQNLPVVGIGGSVRTMGKIDRYRKDYAMFIAHNYSLDYKDVDEIYALVKAYLQDSSKKIYGLGKDREDIFIGSVAAIETLMETIGSRKIYVSGAGVRDGLLFEYLLGGKKKIKNVLEFSLENIIRLHMYKGYEGKELFAHARVMYTELCKKYPYMLGQGKVLKTATYLYDLGTSLNYYQRDRNTFYNILNSPINGISQKQILMAASAATLNSNNDLLREFFNKKVLTTRDIGLIEKLGILVKIAEALNLGKLRSTKILDVEFTEKAMLLNVEVSEDPMFKREDLGYLTYSFRRIYGIDLKINFIMASPAEKPSPPQRRPSRGRLPQKPSSVPEE
jgi:exopolyphosphatase/guanosine-5'-triphosphate,3'-diphosphate pyrophosphatase